MKIMLIPISLLAGGLLAVRASANTQLSKATGSRFVDRHGWFRLPKREISRLRLGGVAPLLISVALIQVF